MHEKTGWWPKRIRLETGKSHETNPNNSVIKHDVIIFDWLVLREPISSSQKEKIKLNWLISSSNKNWHMLLCFYTQNKSVQTHAPRLEQRNKMVGAWYTKLYLVVDSIWATYRILWSKEKKNALFDSTTQLTRYIDTQVHPTLSDLSPLQVSVDCHVVLQKERHLQCNQFKCLFGKIMLTLEFELFFVLTIIPISFCNTQKMRSPAERRSISMGPF